MLTEYQGRKMPSRRSVLPLASASQEIGSRLARDGEHRATSSGAGVANRNHARRASVGAGTTAGRRPDDSKSTRGRQGNAPPREAPAQTLHERLFRVASYERTRRNELMTPRFGSSSDAGSGSIVHDTIGSVRSGRNLDVDLNKAILSGGSAAAAPG